MLTEAAVLGLAIAAVRRAMGRGRRRDHRPRLVDLLQASPAPRTPDVPHPRRWQVVSLVETLGPMRAVEALVLRGCSTRDAAWLVRSVMGQLDARCDGDGREDRRLGIEVPERGK